MARAKKLSTDPLSRALKERDEARAFQAATNEILTALSRATSDAKPVFAAIVDCVRRLFGTRYAAVFLVKGEEFHLAAAKADPSFERQKAAAFRRFRDSFPQRIDWRGFTGKALRSGKVSQMAPIVGNPKATPQAVKLAKEFGYNSMLVAPLMRDGKPIGAIGTTRPEAKPFAARELALFKAFAAQAVIAIENARLFNETKEALERQTATAEILKVISASPTSTQPVFESIVQKCHALFEGSRVALWQVSDGRLFARASTGYVPEPMPIDRESAMGACVLETRTIHLPDLEAGVERYPRIKQLGLKHGYRSGIYAPLLREGRAIGGISVLRPKAGAFSDKEVELLTTFAEQAVIAIENARLFNETKEALERQTASAEILRVIAGTPADARPVFEAIAQSALRVFNASHAGVTLREPGGMRSVATAGSVDPRGDFLVPLNRDSTAGRAVLDRVALDIPDTEAEGAPAFARESGRVVGFRAIAAAPMLRHGEAIGSVHIMRKAPATLSEAQMALLRSFADQAAIAIENARLFNETQEALERQTATAEILRVISSSPADIQPVFDSILEHAMQLCDAHLGTVGLYDGKSYRHVAQRGGSPEYVKFLFSEAFAPDPAYTLGRMIAEQSPVHLADYRELPAYRRGDPRAVATVELGGARSFLAVPMMKEGRVIGGITLRRPEVRPFTQKQIDLVSTFANQAVIAIENVRLFNETREALERQTATAQILRVISGSPTDTRPVFDVIAKSAMRLFGGLNVAILLRREKDFVLAGYSGPGMEDLPEQVRAAPLDPEKNFPSRAILEGKVLNVTDWEGGDVPEHERLVARSLGIKSGLMVPLLRQGEGIGAIAVVRATEGLFIDKDIALLQSFADQAVIAIENVRLFNETREALEQQTAISEVLRVISDSPTDVKPVLDAVAVRAAKICNASDARIWLVEGDSARHAAGFGDVPMPVGLGETLPLERTWVSGRAILERAPLHIEDSAGLSPGDYPLTLKLQERSGFRTILAVPLMRESRALGAIMLRRLEVRPFSEKQVALLKTFADQAAIAIENVRLFNETKEALEHQTATAEVLQVISSSVADAGPVFDKILASCRTLFRNSVVTLGLLDGDDMVHLHQDPEMFVHPDDAVRRGTEAVRAAHPRPSRDSIYGYVAFKRRLMHFPDVQNGPDVPAGLRKSVELVQSNYSAVYAPLVWEGRGIGTLNVSRFPPAPFAEKEIRLLRTFADQAVIAIQNARLFNETKEALERQTATSEILRVISGSPTDVQPVFEAIAQSAHRLFNRSAALQIARDGVLHVGAVAGFSVPGLEKVASLYPMELKASSRSLRAMREGKVLETTDVQAPGTPSAIVAIARAAGFRSIVTVPLLRGDELLGQLSLTADEVRPRLDEKQLGLLKTFADQAVIAIENVRLFNETKESLEQQTAISEVLRVISSSPADVQPVLEAVAERAARICGATDAQIFLREGDDMKHVARFGPIPIGVELGDARPLSRGWVAGRAVLEGRAIHVEDLVAVPREEYPVSHELRDRAGHRTLLSVPLMRERRALGAISLRRMEVRPFTQKQIALLKTFADQAAIAIENVRLFNETKEALERQTATSEILRVISSSPTDTRPVFDKITESCERLFAGDLVGVTVVDATGQIVLAAYHGPDEKALRGVYPLPLSHDSGTGSAILDAEVKHYADIEAPGVPAGVVAGCRALGNKAIVFAPLIAGGRGIGAIWVARMKAGAFSESDIALLKTFADQAVIAIQNARLFNETREALERQTATAEILRVISGTPTDTQPVFDAIAQNCVRLFGGMNAAVVLVRDGKIELGAFAIGSEVMGEEYRDYFPLPLSEESASGRAILRGEVIQIEDLQTDPTIGERAKAFSKRVGSRAILAAPMIREGKAIGAINVPRSVPGRYTDKQVTLLKTFADQAVIAIENVRLFKELEARTEALTKSVGQLTALGEVGQAISSTLELDEVLRTIVQRAVQLAGLDGGSIYEFEERDGRFHLRAAENIAEEILKMYRKSPIRLGEGAVGRAGATREPVVVEDVLDESYQSRVRELLIKSGSRALLAVPLLREDLLLGALVVNRRSPGPFAPEAIGLLKTFATQSAVAIQNARLFRELAEKSRQLEEASRHKSQFLASMSHELRTPLNAILGFNEMILGQVYGEVPGDMQEPLEDIQKSGKHLLRLINNVLDLAKIEAGKMELALADYSVQDTVESVRSTLRPLAEAKGLELVASVPQDIPLAYGDSGRLTQCLMNLAGNSLKFTKEGRVEIAVEVNNGRLTWRVSDTGIGIPPDKIETLFSEFRQTDATIASEYGGTGLGLSITKKFVEMHGGRISVESELGKGSAFTVEIPLRVTTA